MKIFTKILMAALFATFIELGLTGKVIAATAPTLGVSSSYSVFGRAGVTNNLPVTTTHVWGSVGSDTSITNLLGTQVDGSINMPAVGVEAIIGTAYGEMAAQLGPVILDLAGTHTIEPGLYDVAATTPDGALTLSGAGVYIFRSTSSITAMGSTIMTLTNGADACNVFWQIPTSMAINAGAQMIGTIITDTAAVTLGANASLKGRALAHTIVTMIDNQITEPTCTPPPAGVPGGSTYTPPALPLINITKIPNPLALPLGSGSVTYTYTVTNIGIVPMRNVSVTDNKCTPVTFISGDNYNHTMLDLTESRTYQCTKILTGTVTNIATAFGQSDGGDTRDTTEATVVVGVPSIVPPLIHLVKTPNVFVLPIGGGTVTYTYLVTNPGTEPLHDVSITDNKCTGLPGRVVGHPGDINHNDLLESNETWQFTCLTNLTKTTTNIATAKGSANGFTITDHSSATVVVAKLGFVPGLPKTGVYYDNDINRRITILAFGLLLLTSSFIIVLKRKI